MYIYICNIYIYIYLLKNIRKKYNTWKNLLKDNVSKINQAIF